MLTAWFHNKKKIERTKFKIYYNNLNKQKTHFKKLQKFGQHASYTNAQTFSTI